MASLSQVLQLVGLEQAFYESLFRVALLDQPASGARLGGRAAVHFFLTSGLAREVLREIWGLVDVEGLGSINFLQFARSLQIIACVQQNSGILERGQIVVGSFPVWLPAMEGQTATLITVSRATERWRLVGQGGLSQDGNEAYLASLMAVAAGGAPRSEMIPSSGVQQLLQRSGLPMPSLRHICNVFFPTKTESVEQDLFRALLHVVAIAQARVAGSAVDGAHGSVPLPRFQGLPFPNALMMTGVTMNLGIQQASNTNKADANGANGDTDDGDEDDEDFGNFEGAVGSVNHAAVNSGTEDFGDFETAVPEDSYKVASDAKAASRTLATSALPAVSHSAHSSFGDFVSATPSDNAVDTSLSFSLKIPEPSLHSSFGKFSPVDSSSSTTFTSPATKKPPSVAKIDLSLLYGTPSAEPSSSSSSSSSPSSSKISTRAAAPSTHADIPLLDLFSSYEKRYAEALFFGALEKKLSEDEVIEKCSFSTQNYEAMRRGLSASGSLPSSSTSSLTRERFFGIFRAAAASQLGASAKVVAEEAKAGVLGEWGASEDCVGMRIASVQGLQDSVTLYSTAWTLPWAPVFGSSDVIEIPRVKAYFSSLVESFVSDEPGVEMRISGKSAVAFFHLSGLNRSVLRQIWALSDKEGNGYLSYDGLEVALRLISLCQLRVKGKLVQAGDPLPLPDITGSKTFNNESKEPGLGLATGLGGLSSSASSVSKVETGAAGEASVVGKANANTNASTPSVVSEAQAYESVVSKMSAFDTLSSSFDVDQDWAAFGGSAGDDQVSLHSANVAGDGDVGNTKEDGEDSEDDEDWGDFEAGGDTRREEVSSSNVEELQATPTSIRIDDPSCLRKGIKVVYKGEEAVVLRVDPGPPASPEFLTIEITSSSDLQRIGREVNVLASSYGPGGKLTLLREPILRDREGETPTRGETQEAGVADTAALAGVAADIFQPSISTTFAKTPLQGLQKDKVGAESEWEDFSNVSVQNEQQDEEKKKTQRVVSPVLFSVDPVGSSDKLELRAKEEQEEQEEERRGEEEEEDWGDFEGSFSSTAVENAGRIAQPNGLESKKHETVEVLLVEDKGQIDAGEGAHQEQMLKEQQGEEVQESAPAAMEMQPKKKEKDTATFVNDVFANLGLGDMNMGSTAADGDALSFSFGKSPQRALLEKRQEEKRKAREAEEAEKAEAEAAKAASIRTEWMEKKSLEDVIGKLVDFGYLDKAHLCAELLQNGNGPEDERAWRELVARLAGGGDTTGKEGYAESDQKPIAERVAGDLVSLFRVGARLGDDVLRAFVDDVEKNCFHSIFSRETLEDSAVKGQALLPVILVAARSNLVGVAMGSERAARFAELVLGLHGLEPGKGKYRHYPQYWRSILEAAVSEMEKAESLLQDLDDACREVIDETGGTEASGGGGDRLNAGSDDDEEEQEEEDWGDFEGGDMAENEEGNGQDTSKEKEDKRCPAEARKLGRRNPFLVSAVMSASRLSSYFDALAAMCKVAAACIRVAEAAKVEIFPGAEIKAREQLLGKIKSLLAIASTVASVPLVQSDLLKKLPDKFKRALSVFHETEGAIFASEWGMQRCMLTLELVGRDDLASKTTEHAGSVYITPCLNFWLNRVSIAELPGEHKESLFDAF